MTKRIGIVNVGANTSHGMLRSPIFLSDRTFEFTPIPDDPIGKALPTNIALKRLELIMHDDPEFETNTFGDYPLEVPKASRLDELVKEDHLLFLAILFPWNEHEKGEKRWSKVGRFHLIGELIVRDKIWRHDLEDPNKFNPEERSKKIKMIRNNAHVKRWLAGLEPRDFCIFVGSEETRFEHAIPFDLSFWSRITFSGGNPISNFKGKNENWIIGTCMRPCRIIEDSDSIDRVQELIRNYR